MQTYFWNPWSIFDELERSSVASSPEWPEFDIEDTEDETIVTADLPGLGDDDVEVTLRAPYLIVRGERKAKQGQYLRRDRFQGSFERSFWLGDGYDPDRVSAHLSNGVLTIRLAKAAHAKPRRIKLGGGGFGAKVKELLAGDKDTHHAV